MELTKQAIQKYKQNIEGLDGYSTIVSKIEGNISLNPDIAIEACKSLIEGLCKKALELLSDEYQSTKSIRKNCDNNLPFLVRQAFENIYRNKFEIDIHDSLYQLIRGKNKIDKFIKLNTDAVLNKASDSIIKIAVVRDMRGDISHGRIYPKKDESEIHLAKSIVSITDGICSFMINEFVRQYIETDKESKKLIFEDETDFNAWLDDKYDILSVKVDYSKILFYNAYDKYEEIYYSEYNEYTSSLEEDVIEEIETIEETSTLKNEEIKSNEDISFADWLRMKLQKPSKQSTDESEKIDETPSVKKEEQKVVVQLTSTFDEKTFWTENRLTKINAFSEVNNFKIDNLKKIIEDYLFSDKPPFRDDVADAMNQKPNLKERGKITEEVTDKIIALSKELKTTQ